MVPYEIGELNEHRGLVQGIAKIHPGKAGKQQAPQPVKSHPQRGQQPEGHGGGIAPQNRPGKHSKYDHIHAHIERQQQQGRKRNKPGQTAIFAEHDDNPVEQREKMGKTGHETGQGRHPQAPGPYGKQQGDEGNRQQRPDFPTAGKRQPEPETGEETGENGQHKGTAAREGHGLFLSSAILLIRTIFSCLVSALLASKRKPPITTTSPGTASRPRE
ncbi:MAG: hypothetical protein ACD_75C00369G0001 [uncultured bacterium]|nr:MAG: hypothetical protein ACD_75C00369G0001 [uncultured bacterium]